MFNRCLFDINRQFLGALEMEDTYKRILLVSDVQHDNITDDQNKRK